MQCAGLTDVLLPKCSIQRLVVCFAVTQPTKPANRALSFSVTALSLITDQLSLYQESQGSFYIFLGSLCPVAQAPMLLQCKVGQSICA